ncbi:hypothetical protein MP228_008131 [Amoeboaphelidium protococcarum]|nr:hypothetical protein MP228_008131 [Amoeboaphelidium protococcarum]
MRTRVKQLAVGDGLVYLNPVHIWETVFAEIQKSYGDTAHTRLTRDQCINLVNNVRSESRHDKDKFESPSFSAMPDKRQFMQFKCHDYSSNGQGSIWLWGLSVQIAHLKRNGAVFIDGTFKCAPKPYYQLLTVMTYDSASDLYYPVVWILVSRKHESTYRLVLHVIKQLNEFK